MILGIELGKLENFYPVGTHGELVEAMNIGGITMNNRFLMKWPLQSKITFSFHFT